MTWCRSSTHNRRAYASYTRSMYTLSTPALFVWPRRTVPLMSETAGSKVALVAVYMEGNPALEATIAGDGGRAGFSRPYRMRI